MDVAAQNALGGCNPLNPPAVVRDHTQLIIFTLQSVYTTCNLYAAVASSCYSTIVLHWMQMVQKFRQSSEIDS